MSQQWETFWYQTRISACYRCSVVTENCVSENARRQWKVAQTHTFSAALGFVHNKLWLLRTRGVVHHPVQLKVGRSSSDSVWLEVDQRRWRRAEELWRVCAGSRGKGNETITERGAAVCVCVCVWCYGGGNVVTVVLAPAFTTGDAGEIKIQFYGSNSSNSTSSTSI